jgi:hypothetical protein
MRQFGEFFTEKIHEIVGQLEENLFLEGDRFQEALNAKEEIFKKSPVREAAYAGKSYEKEPELLRVQLENYFNGADGPGPLEGGGNKNGLRGVVVPHIDFQRGGYCYAFAHRELWERNSSRCFIIFGTAHTFMEQAFCLTRKDFMTPLGTLSTDRELIDTIQSHCSDNLFNDEGVHRSEHSVEFQCVFLRYLYPEPIPIKVVPILSGSFHEAVEKGISPMELRPFRDFIDALKESVSSLGDKVAISQALTYPMSVFSLEIGRIKEYDLRILAKRIGRCWDMLRESMPKVSFRRFRKKEIEERSVAFQPSIQCLKSSKPRRGD